MRDVKDRVQKIFSEIRNFVNKKKKKIFFYTKFYIIDCCVYK